MKRITGLLLTMGIFISSCNMPIAGAPDPQIATSAALTVQAALNVTPLASPTAESSVSSTATQTAGTPTYSQPMISVGDVTNCRKGPGTNYERVAQILPTDRVEIIGFFPPNYWIVSSKFGECWVSGEFTTPIGSFSAVPTVNAPPTLEGGTPEAPTFSKNGWSYFCFGTGETEVTLIWNDNANNEKGYRIYRNNELVTELPENSTSFKETILYPGGDGLQYKVEVFNEIGATSGSTDTLFCQ
jgi:hypothetical protein